MLESPRNLPLTPSLWKNCLPWNPSLVPERLRIAAFWVSGLIKTMRWLHRTDVLSTEMDFQTSNTGICVFSSNILRIFKNKIFTQFSRSVMSDSATPWVTAHQASLSITDSRSPLKLMPIKSVMTSRHLILCRPLLLLPPIPPSIRVFPNESTLRTRWPKYWSFSFTSVLPINTQDWSPLGWSGWISLQSKGLSRVFPTPWFKSVNSLVLSFLYSPTLTSIHDYWKNHSLD